MKKNKTKSLKRGLDNLFSGDLKELVNEIENNQNNYKINSIEIAKIVPNPYQARKYFDKQKLSELENSIKENSLINPIIVCKNNENDKYIIIAGERRFRACQNINNLNINAIILENIDDEKLINFSIVENNQRENLNPIEEAAAYKTAMEKCHYTQEQLAKKIGKNRSHIANTIRLLNLSNDTQANIIDKKITVGHGKILAGLNDKELVNNLTQKIIDNKLSVNELANLTAKDKNHKNKYNKFENKLTKIVCSKVEISDKKITIFYHGEENLKSILTSLGIKWD